MRYQLAITDRMYSSWSLRGWLCFVKYDLPVDIVFNHAFTTEFDAMMKTKFPPSRQVPAVKFTNDSDDYACCWDSLAIVEELNERHPTAGYWPSDPNARAFCRSLVAEMHASYSALRQECPMNLRHTYTNFQPSQAVLQDCQRIEELWKLCQTKYCHDDGPWLFGNQYTAADIFYAPIATRFVTYNLPRTSQSEKYIQTHLHDMHFRQWRSMAFAKFKIIEKFEYAELSTEPLWPGPEPLKATKAPSVEGSANQLCPYSNKPITHALAVQESGSVYGFCNEFCRDKTMYDPHAWPKFCEISAIKGSFQ